MKDVNVFTTDFGGRELKVEIGKLAGQAHGACTVQYGDTVVLATAVMSSNLREGVDYFPLMVDYEERLYAAGKIKGSRFIKREGKASDEAVLTARMIDRSIRPLFKDSIRRDVQVIVTVLSIDAVNDADIPAMIATSIALGISPIPWNGPIAGVRIGRIDSKLVLNPSYDEREKSDFDLVVAGTDDEVVMIEASGNEVQENDVAEAITMAQKKVNDISRFVKDIINKTGAPKHEEMEQSDDEIAEATLIDSKVRSFLKDKNLERIFSPDKSKMKEAISALKAELDTVLKADSDVSKEARAKGVGILELALEDSARDMILDKKMRVDGRGLGDVRELTSEVGLLPRTHGSALFSRGETQVLSVVTLGSPGDEQILDTMEEDSKKRYMHHYNFPAFSVGEVKPMRFPSRREVGHGALAEKAIMPLLPSKDDFPYTIRVVSEVLSSNGSSSQASVCGSSMALMDAGVPLKNACAGIAMGLVTDPKDKSRYHILTDIQGLEDHAGDMDFKVAGTKQGMTAIQLDIKLNGISLEIVGKTLTQAREARLHILETMSKAIPETRAELSEFAPRITTMRINPDRIREVIGSGGKVINEIIETCEVEIDIEDDGLIMITAEKSEGALKAKEWIEDIVRDVKVGEIIEGKVLNIITDRNSGAEIGAIVSIGRTKDGMVHISQIRNEHIEKVSDYMKEGDTVKAKVVEVDAERGRVSLSVKALLPQSDRTDRDSQPPRRDTHPRRPFSKPRSSGGGNRRSRH